MKRSIYILISLLFVSTGYVWANPLTNVESRDILTLSKGSGLISLRSSYKRSSDFFVGSRRQDSAGDNTFQKHEDWAWVFRAIYGLTDRLNLWLSVPIVYRNESRLYNASDAGMGDFTTGVRYLFWQSKKGQSKAAFDLNGKFPSGDTDVHFSNPSTGDQSELPLGTGCHEIEPAFIFQQRIYRNVSALLQASYTFRISALVEYLSTSNIDFTADDGTVYALPVGNLRIDWGDQITLRGSLGYKFLKRFRLETGVTWFYRHPITIDSFDVTQNGDTITSTPKKLKSSSSQLWVVSPSLFVHLTKRWSVRATADIPILGKNWPILPLVESAVGSNYSFEVVCAF